MATNLAALRLGTPGHGLHDTRAEHLGAPIMEGVDLPVSLTYANRTALIDEDDLFGQVGFTIDTATLFEKYFN